MRLTLKELQELRETKLPEKINLTACEVIIDPKKFVEQHLSTLEGNRGNAAYMPYYERLVKIYHLCKKS